MDGKLKKISESNERTQRELKKVNYVLKTHTVVHNGVNLTTTEAIHRIFV